MTIVGKPRIDTTEVRRMAAAHADARRRRNEPPGAVLTGTVPGLCDEVDHLRAEVERLRFDPTNLEKMLGIDPNDPLHKLAMVAVEATHRAEAAEAKVAKVQALVAPQWRSISYDRNALIDDVRRALDGGTWTPPMTGPRAWFWTAVHGAQNRWLAMLGATVCRARGHRWCEFDVCTRCYGAPHPERRDA